MGVACVHVCVCVCARASRSSSVRITHRLVLQLTSSSNKGHKRSLVNIITMLTFEGSPISDQKKNLNWLRLPGQLAIKCTHTRSRARISGEMFSPAKSKDPREATDGGARSPCSVCLIRAGRSSKACDHISSVINDQAWPALFLE